MLIANVLRHKLLPPKDLVALGALPPIRLLLKTFLGENTNYDLLPVARVPKPLALRCDPP